MSLILLHLSSPFAMESFAFGHSTPSIFMIPHIMTLVDVKIKYFSTFFTFNFSFKRNGLMDFVTVLEPFADKTVSFHSFALSFPHYLSKIILSCYFNGFNGFSEKYLRYLLLYFLSTGFMANFFCCHSILCSSF